MLLDKRITNVLIRVCSAVGRRDVNLLQPVKGRKALVVSNGCFEKVDDFFVFAILRTVARDVEGRIAGRVLREFMSPETSIILVLCDPVVVHVLKQIVFAERLEESANVGAVVSWHWSSIGFPSSGIRRWNRIVLASKVTILTV